MQLRYFILSLAVALSLSCSHSDKVSDTQTNSASTQVQASSSGKPIHDALLPRGIDYSSPPNLVSFGSCANQDAPQPLWKVIEQHDSDLFIYMGDVVYAVNPSQQPVGEQYKKLSAIPEYRSFREKVPFMAIWDDNDYGQRDGGADNPQKDLYRREFLRHFPYIRDSIPLKQGGLYHAKILGGQTITRGKRRRKIVRKEPALQVIVLDTRYYRSPLKPAENPQNQFHKYDPWTNDTSKTLLGEEQWKWLEEQLKRPADLRFIVSGIQVIPNEHYFEKWGNFPHERQRLFDLIKKTKARNTVILSGDRHMGIIAKQDIPGFGPLFEVTASSINRPSNLDETDPTYLGQIIKAENFGLAHIDWKQHRVRLELRDIKDQVVNSVEFKF